MRLALLSGIPLWIGAALLLSRLRWFSRPRLADRLRPYSPGGSAIAGRAGVFSAASFREVIGPLSSEIGSRVASVFGVDEDLATRLARVHSPLDATAFRVRQLGWSVAGLGIGALAAVGLGVPAVVGLLLVFGVPLLAFLLVEQQLARQSARWQQRLFLELPVLAEQLGMLLSAGYSLGAALNRLAARGKGSCGRDLARVSGRIRQGLSEVDALREWAALARVDGLDRLVSVLSLNREAGDLGRLISQEARSIRRDVHRQLVEVVERRGQEVWIPVTVATLLPGVIFLSIPFIEAMRLFTET
ncbi:MAG: tight adherence protein [Acidimicrobiaceae bacterium]